MIYFVLWFRNDQERSVRDQVWPGAGCWDWKRDTPSPRSCRTQWYNLTGIAAFFFLLVLVVTSLNWFRRHYYKQFYVFHMVCGFGFLGMAIMHWRPIITFLAPSIIYYLASTMPAFVQAISSRVRGGVRILQVVHIPDAGGVKEVHIATTPEANRVLETSPSMYVKLAAPSISLVSHPFTVFKHPRDPTTVRVLMRPVGPFTKALIKRWEKVEPTPVVVDGFIQTGNRCHEGKLNPFASG